MNESTAIPSKDRTGRGKGRLFYRMWKMKHAYFFLIPIFAFLITFKYGPFLIAIVKSLYQWNGANINKFVGLDNFAAMLRDASFHQSLVNVVILTIGAVIANLTLPLLAALLVFHIRNKRAAEWVRVAFIIPLVVPGIVLIKIWSWIYAGQGGILNELLTVIGLGNYTHAWLGESGTALWALLFYNFPWIGGIFFLIYLAGLMNIPQDLFEAGQMDGMTMRQRLWHLELPLIRGQIKLIVMLVVITQMQNFELPLLLTGGGPGDSSLTPALHLYNRAFTYNEMGYASALGVTLFLIILAFTIISQKYMKSTETID